MAITIVQSPNSPSPVFNDQNWLVSSNNTGNANFQFIAEVCDASGNLLVKLKRPIEAGTTKGWFSVGRIIEQYLTFNFAYSDIVAGTNGSSYYQYQIKFGEEYGSTVTEYLNLTGSSNVYTWNAALKTYEFPLFDVTDWQYTTAATTKGRFLTPIRNNYPTTINQKGMLWLLQTPSAPPNRVKVIAYNAAGTATTSVYGTSLTSNVVTNTLIRIPAHPYNLNNIASLVSGTPGSVIPADTVYYTLQMFNTSTAMGELMRFNVNCESNFSTPIYLYWLNRQGGFDSFVFDGLNKFKTQTNRKQYTKNHRTLATSTYNYAETARAKTDFYTDSRDSMTLVTRWLNATEAELLDGLATSPMVYMLKDGIITAMNLVGTSHDQKTGEEYGAFQYEYELEYSLIDFSQRF